MNLRVNPTLLSGRGAAKLHCKYWRWKAPSSASNEILSVEEPSFCSSSPCRSNSASPWFIIAWGRENLMSQCLTGLLWVLLVLFHLCPSVLSTGFLSVQADTTHPLTKHRKIASSFRDSSLFDIFTLSCNLLKQVRKRLFVISLGGCMLR